MRKTRNNLSTIIQNTKEYNERKVYTLDAKGGSENEIVWRRPQTKRAEQTATARYYRDGRDTVLPKRGGKSDRFRAMLLSHCNALINAAPSTTLNSP